MSSCHTPSGAGNGRANDIIGVQYLLLCLMVPLLGLGACTPAPWLAPNTPIGSNLLVYGQDDRIEIADASGTHRALARSVAALVWDNRIGMMSDQLTLLREPTLSAQFPDTMDGHAAAGRLVKDVRLPLCTNEPFADQPLRAFCTGFLVGPDLLATAGHCLLLSDEVTNDLTNRCPDIHVVFDFRLGCDGSAPDLTPLADDVYQCSHIVAATLTNRNAHPPGPDTQDWALIRLDRPVVGRTPLPILREGVPAEDQTVTVIGHPVGLPQKSAPNGVVQPNPGPNNETFHYYSVSSDTYNSNSGSPVFDDSDLPNVAGVLVRGETDWFNTGTCLQSNVCSEATGCAGDYEHVQRMQDLALFVPELSTSFPPLSDTCSDGEAGEPNDTQFDAGLLLDGPHEGDICGATDEDWFSFPLAPQEWLRLDLTTLDGREGLTTDVTAFDAGVEFVPGPQGVRTLHYPATIAEGLLLRLESDSCGNHRYRLEVAYCRDDAAEPDDTTMDANPLALGTTTAQLCGQDVDWYRVLLSAGETLDLSVSHQGDGRVLTTATFGGDVVYADTEGSGAFQGNFVAESDGELILSVRGDPGAYMLATQVTPPSPGDTDQNHQPNGRSTWTTTSTCQHDIHEPDDLAEEAGAFTPGDPVEHTICPWDDEDWTVVELLEGQTLHATAQTASPDDAVSLEIRDPGAVLATGVRPVPLAPLQATWTATDARRVWVRVAGSLDLPWRGTSYSLDIGVADVAPAAARILGLTGPPKIRSGETISWQVHGPPGERVAVYIGGGPGRTQVGPCVLGIREVRRAGEVVLDTKGVGTISRTLPSFVRPQAVAVQAIGWNSCAVSLRSWLQIR